MTSRGRRDAPRPLVVATVTLGTVSTILSATIVNVAFPALIAEFHVGHDTLQWVAAGFLPATTATMLATAWLTEVQGERRTFVATLGVFLFGSLLGASSWNIQTLIVARVLHGAAAGVLQPLAMIVLFRIFPVEERGRAMVLYGFGIVLAPAVGPAIGGALVESLGWRSIFLLSVPFCIAGLALGALALPGRGERARLPFDRTGAALLIAALAILLNVPVVGHRRGFASIVSFAYGIGLFGTTYLVPVFVQQVAACDAAKAGYLLVPAGIALAAAISIGGRFTDRTEPSRIVVGGLVLFAVSSALLAFSDAGTGFVLLALWLVIGRVGLGMLIPALNVGAVQALTGTELAYASSMVNFVRQLGGAVGVNLLAVVLEWRLDRLGTADAARAFHECFAIVTLAFALAIVPAWSIRSHRR